MRFRITLLFCLAALAVSGLRAQHHPLWNEGIRGPVKSIREQVYEADETERKNTMGRMRMTPYATAEITCDEQGRIQEQQIHDPGYRDDFARYVYTYDNTGRCTARLIYYPNGELSISNLYRYNAQGEPAKIICKDADNTPIYTTAVCHLTVEKDRIVEKLYTATRWHTERKPSTGYIYTLGGDMIEDCLFDDDGEPYAVSTYEYEYDERGNWTERREYDEDGDLLRTTFHKITYWP